MSIDSIRDSHGNQQPFAIWELRELTKHSQSQISKILKNLIYLDLIFKLHTGYNNRIYKPTKRWNNLTLTKIIESYELHRMIQKGNAL